MQRYQLNDEWIEVDGLGGFASGTVGGARTRRYHGLLLAATNPPTGRMMLVNGFDAWVEASGGAFAVTTQQYAPGVVPADQRLTPESFDAAPWPRWVYKLPDGTRIEHEIFAVHGKPIVALCWRRLDSSRSAKLHVRPFLSGRDYHSLHHANPAFRFDPQRRGETLVWSPYEGVPRIALTSNAEYRHEPHWYRCFHYEEEKRRGLDCVEDLAAPGVLTFDLGTGEAVCLLSAGAPADDPGIAATDVRGSWRRLRDAERERRSAFPSPLHRAADQYFVRRGAGKTIVAGYPWFTDWGRDTFIALRGLGLAAGRFQEARDILLEWSGAVSEGMLPNRFPDHGETPEYNAVDASLWYVVGVHELLQAVDSGRAAMADDDRKHLLRSVNDILDGYAKGTRFNIHCDDDGLLAAGEPGVQLTWMDAKVGDWVVTPRIGKPVEVQALWLNALGLSSGISPRWGELFERGRTAFRERFWNEAKGCLYDVVDCDHVRGSHDARVRPNQIFAVGGLPLELLEPEQARRVVDAVEQSLLTPVGLRSLAPDEPEYAPHYRGGVRERDGAYHQGTVWPWLLGPFVEAWVRVRGATAQTKCEARSRFLAALQQHLGRAGLGHVSEVFDGASPHMPGGCPFQAWSLSELIRLERGVLAEDNPAAKPVTTAREKIPTAPAARRSRLRRA